MCLQHSGGAPNISPDPGYGDDTYDEWDNYEQCAPPPAPPPPPMPNDPNNGGQHFQVMS